VGGVDLAPISAEITYGLERIAMFLQKVDNVFDLEWGAGVKYREVRFREEVEQSRYAFNQDTGIDPAVFAAFHRDQFDKHYEFCERFIKANLLLPALEFCLKCSHLFNLLDSSGSIGVTERTAYVLRVRQLAVAICKQYAAEEEAGAAAERAKEEEL
jgi:glycyl-tRNA synthetase alpha chain